MRDEFRVNCSIRDLHTLTLVRLRRRIRRPRRFEAEAIDGAKLTDQVLLINKPKRRTDRCPVATAIVGPLLFSRSGVVERAVFVGSMHRPFVSGSDRDDTPWEEDYEIPGVDGSIDHSLARGGTGGETERKSGAAARQKRDRGKAVRNWHDNNSLSNRYKRNRCSMWKHRQ